MKPTLLFAYRHAAFGGVAIQLLNRYRAFSQHFEVHFLFEHDYDGATSQFPSQRTTVAATRAAQVEVISRLRPDLFVVIDSGFRHSWELAGSPGRLIIEVHTTTKNMDFVDQLTAASRIDLVLTPTKYLAGELAARGVAEIAPIRVVPNCLGPEWYRPVEPWIAPVPMVLWVGRLEPHKQWWLFVDICEEIRERFLPVFVGGAIDKPDELREFSKRYLSAHWSHPPVWLSEVRYEHMPRLLTSVGVSGGALLVTSRNESFSNLVAEACLAGCPTVAPAVGGIPELLPGEWLYSPWEVAKARHMVARQIDDPGIGRAMIAEVRPRIAELCRPERAAEQFLAALSEGL